MSNSTLIDYKNLTKRYSTRTNTIKKITIHHMAGKMTAKQCCDFFANGDREASSNYCIGYDGSIGLSVEEKNRAWTTGVVGNPAGAANDHQAVTIEVSDDGGAPDWHVSDKALKALIDLCVDICQRNGIKKLNYTGDTKGNLTRHDMFANTTCPGPYLGGKFPYIAEQVNKKLGAATETTTKTTATTTTTKTTTTFKAGDLVTIKTGATYYDGSKIPSWVISQNWYIKSIAGDRAVIDKNEAGTSNIGSPVNTKNLTQATVRKLKVGDTVRLRTGATTYDGKKLSSFVYKRNHKIKQLNGSRAVISYAGITVAAVNIKDLTFIK